MVGRPGAGLLPLRGHSNIQGVGSMGVVPQLKGPVLEALERELGFTAPLLIDAEHISEKLALVFRFGLRQVVEALG